MGKGVEQIEKDILYSSHVNVREKAKKNDFRTGKNIFRTGESNPALKRANDIERLECLTRDVRI